MVRKKVFFNMANELAEKGYQVTALAMENKEGQPFFHVAENVNYINAGVGFEVKFSAWENLWGKLCPDKNKRHMYRDKIVDQQKAAKLEPIIEKIQPDIIISYNAEATRLIKLHTKLKCPVITMFHFNPSHILENCTMDTKIALSMSECIQVLLPSFIEETRQYIKNKNIVSIANCVPQYNEYNNTVKKNVIINVGRLDSVQKRQHLLIKAFALIVEQFPDWKIEFWGETDFDEKYYNYCKSLIKKHHLEKNIAFKGTTNDVIGKLKYAKIFAFPSSFEGFSLALTEAMSFGLPSIGYQNGISVNEIIIDGKTGYLCADGECALAEALKKLMLDDDLREKMVVVARQEMKKYALENIW